MSPSAIEPRDFIEREPIALMAESGGARGIRIPPVPGYPHFICIATERRHQWRMFVSGDLDTTAAGSERTF
jgi:hypothetical protein